jgi:hypothetical protein
MACVSLGALVSAGCPTPPPAIDPDAERSGVESAPPTRTHVHDGASGARAKPAPAAPTKRCAPTKPVAANRKFALSANACKSALVCHKDVDGCEVCECGDTHGRKNTPR